MRRLGRRALALVSLGTAVAAATLAVMAALGAPGASVSAVRAAAPQDASHSVAYGRARVLVQARPGARTCFSVTRGASTLARSCASGLRADEISYAAAPGAVGGVAGSRVRAVILKLTRKGVVWATLRRGTFYAVVPKGYHLRALVKVVAGGSRRTFAVGASR